MHTNPNTQAGRFRQVFLSPIGGATLFVAALCAAQQLDASSVPDHSSEWTTSARLASAQRSDEAGARRQRAAQAMCSSDHGPQVLAVWVDSSTVECVNKRGRRLSGVAAEVIHASR